MMIDSNNKKGDLRILGQGITAQAIKKLFPNALMYDDKDIENYDITSDKLTVVSPGIKPDNYLVKNTKNLVSEYDLLLNKEDTPFLIWISGTNGKTTTTPMCQHLLCRYKSEVGGNIGVPIASLNNNSNIWILETSSFSLHYTNVANPSIYILLPITEDHIWISAVGEFG